jgi:glyoxylase-like metal-dependent hydrolase (beta-lactamase superfamily II)
MADASGVPASVPKLRGAMNQVGAAVCGGRESRERSRWPAVRRVVPFAALALTLGCTHNLQLMSSPPVASATTTAGPWASMIFAARTDSGVFVIDLGWGRASAGLRTVLSDIGADTSDVRWAFLTHAHRDHIGAWPSVAHATFVMGHDEVPRFFGDSAYAGFASRVGEAVNDAHRPDVTTVRTLGVRGDTTFALGADTVHAFAVPGHTPGSMAYLFRETLFAGDAANYSVLSGFRGALRVYSDDVARSQLSMRALFTRLDSVGRSVRVLCTAHAKCAPVDSALRARVTR